MKSAFHYIRLLSAFLLMVSSLPLGAQSISITGPTCVIPGTVYLYNISGQWQPGSTVRVCVTGGTLVDSSATCAGGGGILSFVRVQWDSGGQTSGSVAVTSSLGNTSLSVNLTKRLCGGRIDSTVAYQPLDTLTTPAALTVSAPSGGACQPAYMYQWQQSADNLVWANVAGATSAQFTFTGPLSYNGYFRRVVTDNAANVTAYSNVAVIFLNRPMPALFNPPTIQP
ncbi:MAG TPA: hypothetical protein VNV35_04645 [Puia sp.]|nr:hypothetical protein [Puia sp.]